MFVKLIIRLYVNNPLFQANKLDIMKKGIFYVLTLKCKGANHCDLLPCFIESSTLIYLTYLPLHGRRSPIAMRTRSMIVQIANMPPVNN